jgi:hypothetical protein
LEQAAQQNSAIQDKGFACEGLAQKTGKQLVVPRSKLVDKRDDSWAKDFSYNFWHADRFQRRRNEAAVFICDIWTRLQTQPQTALFATWRW